LGDIDAGERIILKLILKYDMRVWTKYIRLRMWSTIGFCEHGNERSDSIEGRKVLNQLLVSASQNALYPMELVSCLSLNIKI